MAVYLWDASHYDGTLSKTILARAHGEGIVGFTHKLGEGIHNVDPLAQTALAAARSVGIRVIGGYWFNHGNDRPADEVAAFIAEANRHEPWWREFPGWFWQADLERSPTGLPSPAWAKEFCDRLRDATGRVVIAYASHGMYGDTLHGLGHPLWNANYPSSRKAGFKALYPGDGYSGWAKYSGQTPVLCQYTSSATIAGLTTCDANAFRGTLTELLALIGADMTVDITPASAGVLLGTDGYITNFAYRPDSPTHVPRPVTPNPYISLATAIGSIAGQANAANVNTVAILATLSAMAKTEAAIQATLGAVATNASVDTAALAAQIKAIGDEESAAVAGLSARIAELAQQITDLEARLTPTDPVIPAV
jgi:hypothetical protein